MSLFTDVLLAFWSKLRHVGRQQANTRQAVDMQVYSHWTEFPKEQWRWGPEFSPQEMACRGTGKLAVDERSMDALLALRRAIGRPIIVQSAYRSPEHNARVGGARKSQHLQARAFDISMSNHDPFLFEMLAQKHGFRGVGHYPKQNFMHIDTREAPARWHGKGGWFKREADAATIDFSPEQPPERMKEAARDAAGGVLVGTAVQSALEQAAPNLPGEWGKYALIGASVIGLGLALWRVFGSRSAEPAAE